MCERRERILLGRPTVVVIRSKVELIRSSNERPDSSRRVGNRACVAGSDRKSGAVEPPREACRRAAARPQARAEACSGIQCARAEVAARLKDRIFDLVAEVKCRVALA